MAIPDYQTLMLPLLRKLSDGRTRIIRDVTAELADEFKLTADERITLLPSGGSQTFFNRVSWAKTYLKKAGLVSQLKRGAVEITPAGRAVLEKPPARIDVNYLGQFPEFVEFQAVGKDRTYQPSNNPSPQQFEAASPDLTPDEVIETAYRRHWDALADEVIERVKNCSPAYFERLVVQLLIKMGYGGSRQEAGEALGRSGDGGIDGIINEDRLGLDAIYLQAKRWEGSVGEGPIRDFKGALDAKGAQKGVFITTSNFTPAALVAARTSRSYKIVLIDGARLAELMIEHDLGVSVAASYHLKRIDSDFFTDD
jgi:restriction system protein